MSSFARLPMSLMLAAAATLSLFFLMSQLIQAPTGMVASESQTPIEFVQPKEQTPPPPITRRPELTEPDKKPIPTAVSPVAQPKAIKRPRIDSFIGDQGPTYGTGGRGHFDHSGDMFQPPVKTQPQYPYDARIEGIEGYVVFRYNVSPTGRVIDLEIIESKPRGVFEEAIRDATARWSLPGVAGSQVERIDFRFDD